MDKRVWTQVHFRPYNRCFQGQCRSVDRSLKAKVSLSWNKRVFQSSWWVYCLRIQILYWYLKFESTFPSERKNTSWPVKHTKCSSLNPASLMFHVPFRSLSPCFLFSSNCRAWCPFSFPVGLDHYPAIRTDDASTQQWTVFKAGDWPKAWTVG